MVLRGSAGSAVAIGRGEGAAGEPAGRVLCIKSGRGGRVVCRKAAAPQAPGTLSALRSVIAVSTHLRRSQRLFGQASGKLTLFCAGVHGAEAGLGARRALVLQRGVVRRPRQGLETR